MSNSVKNQKIEKGVDEWQLDDILNLASEEGISFEKNFKSFFKRN